MKEHKGKKVLEAEKAIKEMKFSSVTLTDNNKIISINHGQFLTSIINNMKQRLFKPTSSHESTKSRPDNSNSIPNIISELGTLEVDQWPAEINPGFGENEIESLCKRFRLPFSKTITAYRDFLENGGRHIPPDLKPLIGCSKVIPCSSSECKRGFSSMNLIVTETRSRLLINHVSSLMFIKLHGPPISTWKPDNYVQKWLKCHRSATDTQTRRAKSKDLTEDPVWKFC